ncbi:MAG: ABC transporter permease [Clostridium sp.]|nr:ABC transporter permease [Clostridium sp.]
MKQLKSVFKFELKGMLMNKSLLITTAIMCAFTLLITTIPSIIVWFDNDEINQSVEENPEAINENVVVYQNQELKEALSPVIGEETYASEEELVEAIRNEEVSSGFVVIDFNSYKYITYDQSMNSFESWDFGDRLKQANENRLFAESGMDVQAVREILNQPIEKEDVFLGKEAGSSTAIAFAIIFIMYMLILLYGNNVATSVAREKDSRTMELLITSTKPRTLILGKVAAVGLTGILQMIAIILFGILGFFLNKTNYPEAVTQMIQGSMTLDTMLVYILFSVMGYILYLFIYASLGSLVSKVEDVNKSVAPITFLFVIAYLAATVAMTAPDLLLIKISSFIPFISLFTMPIRYMFTSVPLISLLASSAIMILTVVLFAALSIYIYRFGSLNYGNRLTLKEVLKSFKR